MQSLVCGNPQTKGTVVLSQTYTKGTATRVELSKKLDDLHNVLVSNPVGYDASRIDCF